MNSSPICWVGGRLEGTAMATLMIRNLDPTVKERLRVRAAEHGHSMEAEARDILAGAVAIDSPGEINLAEAIRRRFAPFGGVELALPVRLADREPPRFE